MNAGPLLGLTLAAMVSGCVWPAIGAHAMNAEKERNCVEAEQRYQQLFGKPSKDEPLGVILMFNNTFCPPEHAVKQGARVRFVNVDRRTSHSVWFRDAGKEETERVFPQESVEMAIDLPPGEHTYLCGPHWESDGMIGLLRVMGN